MMGWLHCQAVALLGLGLCCASSLLVLYACERQQEAPSQVSYTAVNTLPSFAHTARLA